MRIIDMARAAFVLLALGVTSVLAADFTRFQGGGPVANDCLLVEDVAGVRGDSQAASCTDGDPACDADGVVNDACTFRVRLCLNAAPGPECKADVITAARVKPARGTVAPLATALASLPMPVATPDTCTDAVTVPVATRGHGRMALSTVASGSGRADRDRFVLLCRPSPFRKIERMIFKLSCTSTSCHGDAAAGGLSLEAGHAYENLVGAPATNPAARAAGVLRVAPGHPERSFLLAKLEGRLGPSEGQLMPRGGQPLSQRKIDLVRQWIESAGPVAALPSAATSEDGSIAPPAETGSAQ